MIFCLVFSLGWQLNYKSGFTPRVVCSSLIIFLNFELDTNIHKKKKKKKKKKIFFRIY